jgi:hypothetical protein
MASRSRQRPRLKVSSWLIPGRREERNNATTQAKVLYWDLYESWKNDSTGALPRQNGLLDQRRRAQVLRHLALLDEHKADVDKYLYQSGQRLARIQHEYSWHLREERLKEVERFLTGLLGESYPRFSLGLLVRCPTIFPHAYSWDVLVDELELRAEQQQAAPKPGFQRTLEFVRCLSGDGFEVWLEDLLRFNGLTKVYRTPASRDQGADLIVNIGARR